MSPDRPQRTAAGRLAGPLLGMLFVRAVRTYSVWSYQGDQLGLCVLDHGDGPGAYWARSLSKGDEVLLRKPEGTFVTARDAAYHVFAGEETASVAFGAMLGALSCGERVYGAIAHLVSERGWPRRSVLVKPFWAPGKRGME